MKRPCLHKSCPGPLAGDNVRKRTGASIRGAGGALRTLGAFARDTSGAVAIMVVLLVPVLVGFMGISVDVGLWYVQKRSLQTAADAAATSGAFEIVNDSSKTIVKAAAVNDAIRNGCNPCVLGKDITVNVPPLSGPNAGKSESVEVIISRPMPLMFSTLFLDGPLTARVRAVANAVASEKEAACFVSLDPTAKNAIGFQSVQAQLTGCGIKANSDDPGAIGVGGNSAVVVNKSEVSVTGNVDVTGLAKLTITDENGEPASPNVGSTPSEDPFEDVDVPKFSGCGGGGPGGTTIDGVTKELSPGVYCGGLRIENSASVTFKPGVYIIDGGDLKFLSKAVLKGAGVVFVLTGDPSSTIGSLTITGEASLQMTPPVSGDLKNIMFYQDRNAPSGTGNKNKITGKAQLQTNGAFYFPAQELEITGNAQIQITSNSCAGFIARKLSLEATQIQIDCNPDSPSAVKVTTNRVARLGE